MDMFDSITERILNQMDNGVLPWKKSWASGLPKSLCTGKEYRGINILILGLSSHTSRDWLTFNEAKRQGGFVKKGEKATPVFFWHWRSKEEISKLMEQGLAKEPAPCKLFVNYVFNLDQVEGIKRAEDDNETSTNERYERADNLLSAMPSVPEIIHKQTAQPCYSFLEDKVVMPHLSQFKNSDEYYGTLFHELVHSTGHKSRLDRFAEEKGAPDERYSFEELVAEFGAAFLCGFSGIKNDQMEAQQSSYLEGWAQVFRKDKKVILRAASAAQKAVDYIRGKQLATSTEVEFCHAA